MKKIEAAVAGAALVVALSWSDAAAACPACVDPKAQNTEAMLVSTLFMSTVPLIFLFSVAFWVYRRNKNAEHDLENRVERDPHDNPLI